MFKLFLVIYAAIVLAGFTCMFLSGFLPTPDNEPPPPADAIGFAQLPEQEKDDEPSQTNLSRRSRSRNARSKRRL